MQVRGVGNLLTQLAGCCRPLPGDAVTGFITQGRGVSIHRADCARLLKLQESAPDRIIEVEFWRVPAAHIPEDRDARIGWLYDQLGRVDEWVGRRSGTAPAPSWNAAPLD